MKKIPQAVVEQSMDYATYRDLIDRLMADGKTTGPDHRPAMLEYTRMNVVRMKRLDKTTRLTEQTQAIISQLNRPLILLTLTEGWCGDAAQIIPVVEQILADKEEIKIRYILRDEHPDIMDAFLTNGGRSIPKYIFLDARSLEVLGSWGPRPKEVQDLMLDTKKILETTENQEERKAINEALKTDIQRWYAKDKTRQIQAEFLDALQCAVSLVAC